MSALKKLETGVPGLDVLTLGGIPEGRATLIAGKSGTGKTVVGLQIASNLARQGVKTILLAVEESPEDMHDSGDTLGLGISRLVREGKLHFANVGRPMDGPTIVSGDYDLFGLIHRIEAMVKQTGARAVILDSATALFSRGLLRKRFAVIFSSWFIPFARRGSRRSSWQKRPTITGR